MFKKIFFILLTIIIFASCNNDNTATPKPRGYPRVIFPTFDEAKRYQKFDENYCQFTFDYPVYGKIEQDALFFDQAAPSACWFNINMPSLNAVLHCSYYDISQKNKFEKLRSDAFSLAGKHVIKADFIDDRPIHNPQGVSGFAFDIQGPAACPFQFYMTDSSKHFLRGALYINAAAKPDSLAPVIDFLKKDMGRLIATFAWKKS